MAVTMAKDRQRAIADGLIPDDMGLLPDTFIMPRWNTRPSWIGNFKGRWQLEKVRWKTRFFEVLS